MDSMNSERLSPSLSIAFVLFVLSLACRLALLGGEEGEGGCMGWSWGGVAKVDNVVVACLPER